MVWFLPNRAIYHGVVLDDMICSERLAISRAACIGGLH